MKHIQLIPVFALLLQSARAEDAPADYEIHEWGTFTTMHDSQGTPQAWYSASPVKELPEFVYQQGRSGRTIQRSKSGFMKSAVAGAYQVRMETPVVYFHSSAKRRVSLMAQFFNGTVSEWYPRASESSSDPMDAYVLWDNIELDPSLNESAFPSPTPQGEHYFAARRTSATPLRVPAPANDGFDRSEAEKFLFYRGAFNAQVPVTLRLSEKKILQLQAALELPECFILEARGDGTLAWQRIGVLAADKQREVLWPENFLPAREARPPLETQLVEALAKAGLFPDEAKAMVDTWKNDWLGEQGKRLLCIIPQTWLDKTIVLSALPKPRSVKRVFVSRMEYFDAALEDQIAGIITSSTQDHAGARAELQKLQLGRFQPQLMNIAVQRLAAKNSLLAASLQQPDKPLSAR